MIYLGKKREPLWDDYLIDKEQTTAFSRLMHPEKKEVCFWFDKDAVDFPCVYFSIVKDEKGYKLYYINWAEGENKCKRYLAVLESEDGIVWTQPNLNFFPHPELQGRNNVIFENVDVAAIFYDTNPNCPSEEKYKGVEPFEGKLWVLVSPDGYHFKRSHYIETEGHFDSMNTAHFRDGKYACYFRSFHDEFGQDAKEWINENIRDVRVTYSEDGKTWTKQRRIEFIDGRDEPLYTNCIYPYERAPQILVGFPTRYCERKEWSQNEEQLASVALKKELMGNEHGSRVGRTATDCVFMCSRDGVLWHRFNEAFMSPGYENEHNWIYGDCYPAWNVVDSGKNTYYMYALDRYRSQRFDKGLCRYEIRKDGFACYMADADERVLVTKPLIFEGKDLHLNFSTSARGYIFVDVLDENGNLLSENSSFEIYGDTIDRKISFADGSNFSSFAGKPIRLQFRMLDAKLYSLKFE